MKTTKESRSNEELKAGESWKSRLAIWSGLGVVAVLLFGAVVAFKDCRTTDGFIDLALALVVFGEVQFHRLASKDSDELQHRSEARVHELERAGERRQLKPEQIDRIAEKMRRFSGTEYVKGVNSQLPEIMDLLRYIEIPLFKAGWKELDCPVHGFQRPGSRTYICDGAQVENVSILLQAGSEPLATSDEQWNALWDTAMALADALTAEGIDATFDVRPVATLGAPPHTNIHVIVGPKRWISRTVAPHRA